MAGHKKFCEKCGVQCKPPLGFIGIKPDKFPRYKWVCDKCRLDLGGSRDDVNNYLLPRFKSEGLKADKI